MKKLSKYLKPYLLPLLICMVLLFGQALCSLNLPNYMSSIINIGIQQNGVEQAAPKAISENGFNFISTFITPKDKNYLLSCYTLETGSSKNIQGRPYSSIYPKSKKESIYVLKKLSASAQENLNSIFGTASWTFFNTMKSIDKTGSAAADSSKKYKKIDMEKLYRLQPVFERLPRSVIIKAREESLHVDYSMRLQSGCALSAAFYRELGLNMEQIQNYYILKIGLAMLMFAFLGAAAGITVKLLSTRLAAGAARDLRSDLFSKVQSFSSEEFNKFSTASLITRSTNDISQLQDFLVSGIRIVCYAPFMAVGGIILALRKSSSMSWIIVLTCVVLTGIFIVVYSIAMPKFKSIQGLIDRITVITREILNGFMVTRAFGTQKFEENRFDAANRNLTKTLRFVNRVMSILSPTMTFVMNCTGILILWVGSHQVVSSSMQVGDIMAFLQYSMQIIISFLMISMMFVMIPRASVSAQRIVQVLETEPSITDPENPALASDTKKGIVEFCNVSFHFQNADTDALSNISFTAKPGTTTAIIGSTGSGKSTLINLIPRFYDVTSGKILVDGIDIRSYSQKELHNKIGYVPQTGSLFTGTIASNLRCGNPAATLQQLQKAAEISQAEEFIAEKVDGMNSEIAQGGSNISGGQKQRLCIARALVKNAEIYIFDDSFSALDFKTDAALRSALNKEIAESTVLIVAQRVSTIMQADQIIMLDNGKIAGIGTHKQLLHTCPQYYEIAASQLPKEELK